MPILWPVPVVSDAKNVHGRQCLPAEHTRGHNHTKQRPLPPAAKATVTIFSLSWSTITDHMTLTKLFAVYLANGSPTVG